MIGLVTNIFLSLCTTLPYMFDMYLIEDSLIEHFVWSICKQHENWYSYLFSFTWIYGDKHLMISIYVYTNNNINNVLIMIGIVN